MELWEISIMGYCLSAACFIGLVAMRIIWAVEDKFILGGKIK